MTLILKCDNRAETTMIMGSGAAIIAVVKGENENKKIQKKLKIFKSINTGFGGLCLYRTILNRG